METKVVQSPYPSVFPPTTGSGEYHSLSKETSAGPIDPSPFCDDGDAMSGGFDMSFFPSDALMGSMAMDGDEYVRCGRCGFGGCDVRLSPCGCTSHAVRWIGVLFVGCVCVATVCVYVDCLSENRQGLGLPK